MSQERNLEARNRDLVRRDQVLIPEFPHSSEAIFAEAIAHIPPFEYGRQTTFATTEVAGYLAEVDPNLAIGLVNRVRGAVLGFPPERTKADCLIDILYFEQKLSLPTAAEAADLVWEVLESGGIPPSKVNARWKALYRLVARKSVDEALGLIQKHFPEANLIGGPSTKPLEVAEAHIKFNPTDTQRAGEVVSQHLAAIDWRGIRVSSDDFLSERQVPAENVAKAYGWLVARHGDTRLAEEMIGVLSPQDPDRIGIIGELGARNSTTEQGRLYIDQARQLLDRDDVDHKIFARLAVALESVDSDLAEQFREKIDLLDVGIATGTVQKILASGNLIEASQIVRTVIDKDLANPVSTYPPTGPKVVLEEMFSRVARVNPQRVVALVDDNFKPSHKTSEREIVELKTDILVEGARSLIDAGQVKEAKELLARAVVLARSLPVDRETQTAPETGEELTVRSSVSDVYLRIKARYLAKVAAAVAKLETVSAGL